MARCMLCSSTVPATAVTCPLCGGAVEEDDATTVADRTHVHGVDLHKAPSEAESSWPGEPQGPPPGAYGLPGALGPTGYQPPHFGPGPGPQPGYGPPPGYGPQPGYGPHGYGPWPGYARPTPLDGMALGSFITSLAGLVTALGLGVTILACPVGAVLGHLAIRRISETGHKGHGFAVAGIVIGWIGTALLVIGIVAVLLWLDGWD